MCLFLAKVILFYSMGCNPKAFALRAGPMGIAFRLSALAVTWAAFCWLLSSNGKVPKIAGGPCGVLLFIAMLCNRANLSPLLSGQKWQNPPGETPGPPLRRTRMGLVAPHAPDRVWRLRVAPPGKEPSANAAKNMGKQPVWRHLSPAGIPSGHPPREAVLGDRLGRRRLSAGD